MNETHSISSLAARLGVTRTATLGAISSGRLPAQKTKAGQRQIYTLSSAAIEAYKRSIVAKLEAKIAKVVADPRRREQAVGSALNAMRKAAAAENAIMTPQKLADLLGIGLEAANYLLGKYGVRVENGFSVTPKQMRKIKTHIEETRGSGIVRNAGGVYVG